jgi:hypothetical protein
VFAQAARSIAHVLPQRFQMTPHFDFPYLFFDLFHAAHLDQGLAAGFFRIDALLDLRLD